MAPYVREYGERRTLTSVINQITDHQVGDNMGNDEENEQPTKAAIAQRHRKIGPLSRRFFQVYLGLISEALAPFEMDPSFYSLLVELHERPGIDQRRLGEALGIDRTTIGQMVDELDRRGLISRKVHAEDRRARILSLTSKGDALRLEIRPHMLRAQAQLEAPLTPEERGTFLELLTRIVVSNLDKESTGGFRRRKLRPKEKGGE